MKMPCHPGQPTFYFHILLIRGVCSSGSELVLRLMGTEKVYDNPRDVSPPPGEQTGLGGDSAWKTFFFQAVAEGETTLTYKRIFRRAVEPAATKVIRIRVEG